MQGAAYTGMSDEQFAWWLVGLTDGEGHFGIAAQPSRRAAGGRPYLRCVFRVTMTATDTDVLRFARERTGWGKLYTYDGRGRQAPYTQWTTDAKSIALVADFFDAHPLMSKKRHDFDIWAPAARAQTARRKMGRNHRDEDAYAIMHEAYERLRGLDRGRRSAA